MASRAFGGVAVGLAIYRYEHKLGQLQSIVNNWDQLSAAYSIVRAVGFENTADLTITLAEHAIPIAKFIAENSSELQDLANMLGYGVQAAAIKADVVDAVVTGGVSIVLSVAAWGFVRWFNAEAKDRLVSVEKSSQPVQQLHLLLASGALPDVIRDQLLRVPEIVSEVGGFNAGWSRFTGVKEGADR
jgi:hypothetical protein